MVFSQTQAREAIVKGVKVTRVEVVLAKTFIVSAKKAQPTFTSSSDLVEAFLKRNEATPPAEVLFHQDVDVESVLRQVARANSLRLACAEAILELVHSGVLVPVSHGVTLIGAPSVKYKVFSGPNAASQLWGFEDIPRVSVPEHTRLAPSQTDSALLPLSDADLYLRELKAASLDPAVEEALRDAIQCFRHELYVPCLAMLGKASETAWLLMGAAIVKILPDEKQAQVLAKELDNRRVSTAAKLDHIRELYDRKDLKPLHERSGERPSDLHDTALWADAVRDSRNSIHAGFTPSFSNTYDKIAVLLIEAIPMFRRLLRIQEAAEAIAGGTAAG